MTAPRLFDLRLPDLPLEHGGVVQHHHARGWWWGPEAELSSLASGATLLSKEVLTAPARVVPRERSLPLRDAATLPPEVPTVLLVHALTGDARAGGDGGWWAPLIGVGRPIDPTRVRVLCFNNLGSNYGSTGPLDEGWPLEAQLSVNDQARALWLALDSLGVRSLQLAAGGSLGGRIVLAMAAQRPTSVSTLMPIGATLAVSAWVVAFNHLQRQLIDAVPGARGLELARQLAMVTYRAEPGLEATQPMTAPALPGARGATRIEGYLEHQGLKLVERFDARAYRTLLDAMDTVELGLTQWRGRAQVVDIDTDQLFTPAQVEALGVALSRAGAQVERATIHSPHGHDAFLIEWAQLGPIVSRAMALAGVAA